MIQKIAATSVLIFFITLGIAQGATLNVPGDYSTIQAAIDAALDDDLILVAADDYTEQLTVDGKRITIEGAGIGLTNIISPAVLNVTFSTSYDYKCIVGVINGGDLTLTEVTVDGQGLGNANYRFIGVGFRNSGGTLTGLDIVDIQDTPFSGSQHGIGVYVYNDDGTDWNVDLNDVDIPGFQKGGIVFNGANVIGSATDCDTIGIGQTGITAQNGIQFGYGASGYVDNCIVDNVCYTGGTWTATGILLYEGGTVDISNCPSIADNQTGVYYILTNGAYDNNTMTAGPNSQGQSGNYWGLAIDDQNGPTLLASPSGDGARSGGSRDTTISVSDSTFDGGSTGYGTGIGAWAVSGDNITLDIFNCKVTNWSTGIELWDDGSAGAAGKVRNSYIFANSTIGLDNYSAPTADALSNWWGHATGPYHATLNPAGQGDAVSDNVDFDPWLRAYLYFESGVVSPGNFVRLGIQGWPGLISRLVHGSGIQIPPQSTAHGDLYLLPTYRKFFVGYIPPTGELFLFGIVPKSWVPGEEHGVQAIVGSYLTNLLVLTVVD